MSPRNNSCRTVPPRRTALYTAPHTGLPLHPPNHGAGIFPGPPRYRGPAGRLWPRRPGVDGDVEQGRRVVLLQRNVLQDAARDS